MSKTIESCGLEFAFSVETAGNVPLAIELAAEADKSLPDTYVVRFSVQSESGEAFTLKELSIRWSVPLIDVHGLYAGPPSPDELAKLPFWHFQKRSAANTGFPYISLFHRGGENRFAFGLVDQVTETELDATLSEADRAYHFRWHKPLGAANISVGQWNETLFISTVHRPWTEVLRAYVETVDREWPQPRFPVPDFAYDPVFCTWTAIHHDVSQEWILRNARLAADLGFGTWLTDDGWFTGKAVPGDYFYTGDWQPFRPKFPDFPGHVRAVQEMGLRYVLWVAPFMVGDASEASSRYAHLLAEPTEMMRQHNLSPRRAQTCRVVVALVERLMREYGLDGLKIDFVDSIVFDELAPAEGDYPTVGHGLYDALSKAADRALQVNPQALIEFRNTYANLASRRYANLYRASDVPINFALNRWQVTMLRLLVPDRAVHLDPALWHAGDTDENVAVHLINAISTVPIISVELDRYPQSHLELIRYWIGFYRAHRDTIIRGEFRPEIHLGHVPLTRFYGEHDTIIGLYDDIAFALGGEGEADKRGTTWVLNASTRPYVDLLPAWTTGKRHVRTRDKFGRVMSERAVDLPVARLDVEVGGSLEILDAEVAP